MDTAKRKPRQPSRRGTEGELSVGRWALHGNARQDPNSMVRQQRAVGISRHACASAFPPSLRRSSRPWRPPILPSSTAVARATSSPLRGPFTLAVPVASEPSVRPIGLVPTEILPPTTAARGDRAGGNARTGIGASSRKLGQPRLDDIASAEW
ncbi:hypothetical protein KM043_003827 [Ampulex compressa]|nr:hypothetical protein KM043_003827 [Ampulex compressa]